MIFSAFVVILYIIIVSVTMCAAQPTHRSTFFAKFRQQFVVYMIHGLLYGKIGFVRVEAFKFPFSKFVYYLLFH